MNDRSFISAEARRILAAPPPPAPDRSAAALPGVRRAALAKAKAHAGKLLCEAGTAMREAVIGGVTCLAVVPGRHETEWPILYGFGGGFVQGSPVEDLSIIAPLCAAIGARVIVPDYRLAPEHPWPAALEDCFAVYRALSERPFAIVGESAGGNLALGLMHGGRAEGLPLPGAAALMSPWCDLGNSGDSFCFNNARDPSLSAQNSLQAVRHYAGEHPL